MRAWWRRTASWGRARVGVRLASFARLVAAYSELGASTRSDSEKGCLQEGSERVPCKFLLARSDSEEGCFVFAP